MGKGQFVILLTLLKEHVSDEYFRKSEMRKNTKWAHFCCPFSQSDVALFCWWLVESHTTLPITMQSVKMTP